MKVVQSTIYLNPIARYEDGKICGYSFSMSDNERSARAMCGEKSTNRWTTSIWGNDIIKLTFSVPEDAFPPLPEVKEVIEVVPTAEVLQ